MWQMTGLGPMLGQHGHFALYAAEEIPYAIERYRDEAAQLSGARPQLGKTGAYVAGDYSIADIASPWTVGPLGAGFTPARRLSERQALVRGLAVDPGAGLAIGKFVKELSSMRRPRRKVMFGRRCQGDASGKEFRISAPSWCQ